LSWKADKTWSDRFLPEIKAILGQTLIATAKMDDDQLRNTDLITLRMPGAVRIACRIRKHPYLQKYADEFTLRCSRPSGNDTEIDKVLAGWGDYLFYGFASHRETELASWFIGDLNIFREWFRWYRRTFQDWPGEMKSNHDGSSAFLVFTIHDIAPQFVVRKGCLPMGKGETGDRKVPA
jgi:hypothetical protein